MKLTRRDFFRTCFLAGGYWFLTPVAPCAEPIKRDRWQPGYAKLEREGQLGKRVKQAHAILERCQLCPRKCGVNRLRGEKGFCRAPVRMKGRTDFTLKGAGPREVIADGSKITRPGAWTWNSKRSNTKNRKPVQGSSPSTAQTA